MLDRCPGLRPLRQRLGAAVLALRGEPKLPEAEAAIEAAIRARLAGKGDKAVAFTEGYVVLEQNLSIENLADRNFRIDVDARSTDGAKLGVYVGNLRVGENGKAAWRNELDVELSAGPGVGEDLVVVGAANGYLIALNADSGEEVWRANITGETLAKPIIEALDGNLHVSLPASLP